MGRLQGPKMGCAGAFVIHTLVSFRRFSQKIGGKHEEVMTTWPRCECALSPSPLIKGKDLWSSPRWSFYPRVHHTSRKRELLVLAWKGSDHMRRKSPCGAQTLV